MKGLQSPFFVGDLELKNNLFYAPLAGCSDLPYRAMGISEELSPALVFCEMVKMDALVRHCTKTFRLLDFTKDMHPIGAQLCGSSPALAYECAQIIEDLGFDLLDLNCGCPVDKVTKDGSGSGMLKNPEQIGEVLYQMVRSVSIPVTVKIRAGWDDDSIEAVNITQIAEQAGAKLITIHGRTRCQAYRGFANWDYIKACKLAAKEILVFGNGDLFCPEDVEKMFEHTHCDGVLVARGTMGNPTFAKQVFQKTAKPLSLESKKNLLQKHLQIMERYQPPKRWMVELKKVAMWYLKDEKAFKELRKQLCGLQDYSQAKALILTGNE